MVDRLIAKDVVRQARWFTSTSNERKILSLRSEITVLVLERRGGCQVKRLEIAMQTNIRGNERAHTEETNEKGSRVHAFKRSSTIDPLRNVTSMAGYRIAMLRAFLFVLLLFFVRFISFFYSWYFRRVTFMRSREAVKSKKQRRCISSEIVRRLIRPVYKSHDQFADSVSYRFRW